MSPADRHQCPQAARAPAAAARAPCTADVRLPGEFISVQQAAKTLSAHRGRKRTVPPSPCPTAAGCSVLQQSPPAALPPNRMSCPSMITAEALHRGTGTAPSVTALCHVHVSVSRKCTSFRRFFSWLRPPKMTSLHKGGVSSRGPCTLGCTAPQCPVYPCMSGTGPKQKH